MNLVFSENSEKEIEKIKQQTGLSVAEIIQYGFSLFRIYVDATKEGKELRIIDPNEFNKQVKIDLKLEKK